MSVYVCDETGNAYIQRPLYVTTSDGTPVPISYVYEYDASGTPRLVYGSGPDWLAKYDATGVSITYNTNYITSIDEMTAGEVYLHGNDGGQAVHLYGMNLSHGFGDAAEGSQGNTRDETKIFRINPNTINLFGAKAISLVGTGAVTASVHGHIDTETYFWLGFGGVETLIFSIVGFALDGDKWGHKIATNLQSRIPINTINSKQEMYFKIRHLQRSPQHLSNSMGVLSLQAINVLYD